MNTGPTSVFAPISGYTPLHIAVENGDIATARELLNVYPVNVSDENGTTPLTLAIALQNLNMVRFLIEEAGADINRMPGMAYETAAPLHMAILVNNLEIAKILINCSALDVNVPFVGGDTPLHLAIRYKKNVELLRLLVLDGKADLTVTNNVFYKTPLMLAVELGNLDAVIFLLEEHKKEDNKFFEKNFDNTFLLPAIHLNHVDITRILIKERYFHANFKIGYFGGTPLHHSLMGRCREEMIQMLVEEFNANVVAEDDSGHTPLFYATRHMPYGVIKYLINILEVRNHPAAGSDIATDDNAFLHKVVSLGDLDTLNLILNYPEVLENITAHNNAALRLAQVNGHGAVIERLMQIPAVRDYVEPDLELAAVAQNHENSTATLNTNELGLVTTVKNYYKNAFERLGQDKILKHFIEYLETQYTNAPAKGVDNNSLPLKDYNSALSQVPYHSHTIHSAWRYFLRPNPWIRPDMPHADVLENGRAAAIFEKSKEILAYFWLAASSEGYTPLQGFTHESIKSRFAQEIAYINRAHNFDANNQDDLGPDQPSCALGVEKRLMQCLLGHPITEKPEARHLSPDLFRRKFMESIVAKNERFPNNLYQNLNSLNLEKLIELKTAMDNEIGEEFIPLTEAQNAVLTVAAEQIVAFIEDCKVWFTPARMTSIPVSWMQDYENYEQFTKALALNLKRHFYSEIYCLVEGLIEEKAPKAVPAMIFSNSSMDTESNNNSDNEDNGPLTKKQKLGT